jgi:hypothetical protein
MPSTQPRTEPEHVTLAEAAAQLRLAPKTLRSPQWQRILPRVKPAGRLLVRQADVDRVRYGAHGRPVLA